ncbi:hypothetical protein ADUPG1_008265 [Aduncisulcus paluster]|uniref:AB hydrolase-1 domain-containing protein n=1 Tax=Aduncisulcus paluster TaxID=2918883 RepID=A0ABQ5KSN2_9EUKA|nr:hypothetical protein ADUPG1_008265 [Aduncisulcus paluster]
MNSIFEWDEEQQMKKFKKLWLKTYTPSQIRQVQHQRGTEMSFTLIKALIFMFQWIYITSGFLLMLLLLSIITSPLFSIVFIQNALSYFLNVPAVVFTCITLFYYVSYAMLVYVYTFCWRCRLAIVSLRAIAGEFCLFLASLFFGLFFIISNYGNEHTDTTKPLAIMISLSFTVCCLISMVVLYGRCIEFSVKRIKLVSKGVEFGDESVKKREGWWIKMRRKFAENRKSAPSSSRNSVKWFSKKSTAAPLPAGDTDSTIIPADAQESAPRSPKCSYICGTEPCSTDDGNQTASAENTVDDFSPVSSSNSCGSRLSIVIKAIFKYRSTPFIVFIAAYFLTFLMYIIGSIFLLRDPDSRETKTPFQVGMSILLMFIWISIIFLISASFKPFRIRPVAVGSVPPHVACGRENTGCDCVCGCVMCDSEEFLWGEEGEMERYRRTVERRNRRELVKGHIYDAIDVNKMRLERPELTKSRDSSGEIALRKKLMSISQHSSLATLSATRDDIEDIPGETHDSSEKESDPMDSIRRHLPRALPMSLKPLSLVPTDETAEKQQQEVVFEVGVEVASQPVTADKPDEDVGIVADTARRSSETGSVSQRSSISSSSSAEGSNSPLFSSSSFHVTYGPGIPDGKDGRLPPRPSSGHLEAGSQDKSGMDMVIEETVGKKTTVSLAVENTTKRDAVLHSSPSDSSTLSGESSNTSKVEPGSLSSGVLSFNTLQTFKETAEQLGNPLEELLAMHPSINAFVSAVMLVVCSLVGLLFTCSIFLLAMQAAKADRTDSSSAIASSLFSFNSHSSPSLDCPLCDSEHTYSSHSTNIDHSSFSSSSSSYAYDGLHHSSPSLDLSLPIPHTHVESLHTLIHTFTHTTGTTKRQRERMLERITDIVWEMKEELLQGSGNRRIDGNSLQEENIFVAKDFLIVGEVKAAHDYLFEQVNLCCSRKSVHSESLNTSSSSSIKSTSSAYLSALDGSYSTSSYGDHDYTTCTVTLPGENTDWLNIVDYAVLSEIPYRTMQNATAITDSYFSTENVILTEPSTDESVPSDIQPEIAYLMDFHFPDRNLSVVSVRGTWNMMDVFEDVIIFFDCLIYNAFVPFAPMTRDLNRNFGAFSFQIEGFLQYILSGQRYGGIYQAETERYVQYVKEQRPDEEVIVVGHSLGGFIASLVAAAQDIRSVTFSQPGQHLNSRKFDVDHNTLWKNVLAVVPLYDAIRWIDSYGIQDVMSIHHFDCPFSAHNLQGSICELATACGVDKALGWCGDVRENNCGQTYSTLILFVVVVVGIDLLIIFMYTSRKSKQRVNDLLMKEEEEKRKCKMVCIGCKKREMI